MADSADSYFVLHLVHLATRRKVSVGYDAQGRFEPLEGFGSDFPWRMHEQAVVAASIHRDKSVYMVDSVDLYCEHA